MMELTALLHTIYTVLLFSAFIWICIWAWSDGQKSNFEEAANLPFNDDSEPQDKDKTS